MFVLYLLILLNLIIISPAHALHSQSHNGEGELMPISPVDEAAFFFQSRLMYEPYALFKVLSPVEQTNSIAAIDCKNKEHRRSFLGGRSPTHDMEVSLCFLQVGLTFILACKMKDGLLTQVESKICSWRKSISYT